MKKILKIFIIILLIFSTYGCKFSFNKKNNIQKEEKKSETTKLEEDIVEKVLSSMTIDQKIAQMLIIYYESDIINNNLINVLKNNSIGGFILMKDNITTFDATRKFVMELKSNSNIPLIIGIDQEGGNVQRLQYLLDSNPMNIPYMYDLGKTNNESLAYEVGKVIGEELKTIGVNVDFAPVVDVYTNKYNEVIGKRSFGENSEIVSKMAISLAKGMESTGIIATYKHFPGHGDTSVDSHYSLPIINKTYEQLKEIELIPFKNAIDNNAKIIMVGHIALPNITNNEEPASLSKIIITDILKKDMGFEGLVITDALNMGALTENYTNEEICVKAIKAGVDLLLMPADISNTIEYIKNNISEERINESVRKILNFKYAYLNSDEMLDKSFLGSDEHKKIINSIYSN